MIGRHFAYLFWSMAALLFFLSVIIFVRPDTFVLGATSLLESRPKVLTGIAVNSTIAIARVTHTPEVTLRTKVANHIRTLRAYFVGHTDGTMRLFIESVRPKYFYEVSGSFIFSDDKTNLTWINNSTLQFYARTGDGTLYRILCDVATLQTSFLYVDEHRERAPTLVE